MKQRRVWAFTLVEVLVVIAIIGILAAILIPAVGRSKQRALSAKCMNNLRQVYLVSMSYADDNEGNMPSEVKLREDIREVLFCPSDSGRKLNSSNTNYISYTLTVDVNNKQKMLHSKSIIAQEMLPWHDQDAVYPENMTSFNDVSGKFMTAWGDGRVTHYKMR